MKKYFLFLTAIYFTTFLASCSKSTTGPLDCRINFKIRFLDKYTGVDLGLDGASFLDSVKITSYVNWGKGYDSIGWDRDIQVVLENAAKYYVFSSSDFDLCNEDIYLNIKENKYIISYAEGMPYDSVEFRTMKINSNFTIIYFLNNSLIDTISFSKIITTDIKTPVINIKK